MPWFKKQRYTSVKPDTRKDMPDGLWVRCAQCLEILYRQDLEKNLRVCPKCRYHFRIGAKERLALLVDDGTFEERDASLMPVDPLDFSVDGKSYKEKVEETQRDTGLGEAAISGTGAIEDIETTIVIMDPFFMMGSMGSVVGEKVTRAIELSVERAIPFVSVAASGGARMQEGTISLMQMAKVGAALARLGNARIPFISILTDPTTGGVLASFASQGDVVIAEPGALIGFAGQRVIKQTIRQELPDGFQRAEFQLEHGFVDLVVHRADLKSTVSCILRYLT
jgi:acetyl-CoA carboxylase carboxyl transferase subunit beta